MLKQSLSISQRQRLSPLQFQTIRLLGLSLGELQEAVNAELEENPALEEASEQFPENEMEANQPAESSEEQILDQPEMNDDLDIMEQEQYQGLEQSYTVVDSSSGERNPLFIEQVLASEESWQEGLFRQIDEACYREQIKQLAKYIVSTLNDSGYLTRDLHAIADDLAFSLGKDFPLSELREALELVQSLEPAGIGASNLQEALLLQIHRKEESEETQVAEEILRDHFELFSQKKYSQIRRKVSQPKLFDKALEEILKLSPKPLAVVASEELNHIVADFIVEQFNGNLYITLTRGNFPRLSVSQFYQQMLAEMNQKKSKTKEQREAIRFTQQKVEGAGMFIEAIRQRNQTLLKIMTAIANTQKSFFLSGDETQIVPMRLKDVSEIAGFDTSTISRSTNTKYVQTEFGVFPLRFFFTEGIETAEGGSVSNLAVRNRIAEIIDAEDKSSPLTDQELTEKLTEEGYKISRRTVAKYRSQLGIPSSNQRTEKSDN